MGAHRQRSQGTIAPRSLCTACLAVVAVISVSSLHAAAAISLLRGKRGVDVSSIPPGTDPTTLSDEQLGLAHGSLTPSKLKNMKEEVTSLSKELITLMANQQQLTTEYKVAKANADMHRKLKATVKLGIVNSLVPRAKETFKRLHEFYEERQRQMEPEPAQTGAAGDETGSQGAGATGSEGAEGADDSSAETPKENGGIDKNLDDNNSGNPNNAASSAAEDSGNAAAPAENAGADSAAGDSTSANTSF